MVLTFPGRNGTGCFPGIGKCGNALPTLKLEHSLCRITRTQVFSSPLREKPLSLLYCLMSVFMDLAFCSGRCIPPIHVFSRFFKPFGNWLACFFFFIYVSFLSRQGIYIFKSRMVKHD
ncbi:hypothetical protein BT93_L0172 [Corymbia citriodora subsp. variegata]|uniref:Uncharacterized protein n=1 Tax=Corymbia citriodora subsp. variegata TaxID=360336 RepID=A0A8T0CU88_CORYI|nr:hypothetical protein BT93_L0172 [Corymbia citriodora subsp. variegata]